MRSRDKKKFFIYFFSLPSVTNTGKQRKWLISNAVLSVQRRKKVFFKTHLVCQELQPQQPNNANLLIPLRSRDKTGYFLFFRLAKCYKSRQTTAYFQCRPLLPKTKEGFVKMHLVCQELQTKQPKNGNRLNLMFKAENRIFVIFRLSRGTEPKKTWIAYFHWVFFKKRLTLSCVSNASFMNSRS